VRRVRLFADFDAPLPDFDVGRPRLAFGFIAMSFSEIAIIRRSFTISRASNGSWMGRGKQLTNEMVKAESAEIARERGLPLGGAGWAQQRDAKKLAAKEARKLQIKKLKKIRIPTSALAADIDTYKKLRDGK
jgi:hypothetical protein